MPPTREALIQRAREATRRSKYLELRERFDPRDERDVAELVRDVAALANTGGGLIVVDELLGDVDETTIEDHIFHFTRQNFTGLAIQDIARDGRPAKAIAVDAAVETPLVFQLETAVFPRGSIYFRHGGKSEPARPDDVGRFIERRVRAIRGAWLSGLRTVMEAPPGTEIAIVRPTAIDPSGDPAQIQLTTDPRAPVYGRLDPDQTHPYRQKELIYHLNARLPADAQVNSHTMLSVRRVHGIDEVTHPEFVHHVKFAGSPQYSRAFLEWLVEQYQRNRSFFETAKARYQQEFRRRGRAAQAEP